MKKRAPLLGGVLLFALALVFLYIGFSKSLPSSLHFFKSQKEKLNQTHWASEDKSQVRDDQPEGFPKEKTPSSTPKDESVPEAWQTVKVSPARVQRWLRRLDEPFGFVKTAVAIKMNPQALVDGILPPGESPKAYPMRRQLRLPLGNGEEVLADQTRIDSHLGDMVTWVGEIKDSRFSDVFLTYNSGVWHGHIKWEHRTFEIAYGEDDIHLLREVDTNALPPDHPGNGKDLPVISDKEAVDEASHDHEVDLQVDEVTPEIAADTAVIRLLGAYNTDAKNKAGGTAAIEAQMGTGASQTTTAFSRGNVDAQMQLVVMREYGYTQNTSSMSTDLGNFRNSSDGNMDDVHTLRDQNQADMTILMVGSTAGGACGVGYLLRSSTASVVKSTQFAVVSRTCATSYYSYAHELGHNMGNHHDPANAGGGGYFSYSTGHFNESARVRTTMSYACPNVSCTRQLYFSNPSVNFSGVPTGVANVSDNSRSLRTTTPLVGNVYPPSGSPVITGQPLGQNVAEGGTVSLSVTATGTPSPSYQWYFNGTVMAGKTSRTLSIANAQTSHSGNYRVRVYNSAGEVTSNEVRVTVYQGVQITTQPVASTTVAQGASFSLSVAASGTGPLTYQWYRNSSAIPGATNATYTVGSASSTNVGTFYVRVANPYSSANSNNAVVTLGGPPVIATQPPTTVAVLEGTTLSVSSVVVGGTSPFTYQWFNGDTAIAGQTNKNLSIPNIQAAQAGGYRLRVTNQYGTAYTNFCQIVVEFPPNIMGQPLALTTVNEGGNVSLAVGAGGVPAVSYQWRRNGTNLAGQTSATLNLSSINRNQAGEYTVAVTNSRGSVISNKAVVVVQYAPEITGQPAPVMVAWGQPATLNSGAVGVPTPTYQWYRNGQVVTGANSANINWAAVDWKDRGMYQLEVRNSLGTVRTQSVELKLQSIQRVVDSEGNSVPISLDRTAGVYGP